MRPARVSWTGAASRDTMSAQIEAVFGPDANLYAILGCERDASAKELKKAFRKRSLLWHPDKCRGDEDASARFVAMCEAHSILADPERRRVYDETGEIVDAEGDAQDAKTEAEWQEYWRCLFPKVTLADIEAFAARYRGSEEERADLLQAYVQFEGDMDLLLEVVMCSSEDDEARFEAVIDAAVAAGQVPRFRIRKGRRPSEAARAGEAKEAEELWQQIQRKNGMGADNPLALIRAKAQQRRSNFEALMERYTDMESAGGTGGGKAKRAKKAKGAKDAKAPKKAAKKARKNPKTGGHDDIDDDEFRRIQERIMRKAGR